MWKHLSPLIPVTPEENAYLQEQRLLALRAAVERDAPTLFGPAVIQEGWKAFLRVHRRNRDGSVSATVEVTNPWGRCVYTRSLRAFCGPSSSSSRNVYLRRS